MTADIDQPRTTAKLTLDGVRMGEQRRSRRADIALQCVLRRAHGSPVTARTRDLGVGGMCVSTCRPLTIDERVRFELALHAGDHLAGHARVLREQGFGFYALRFEGLCDEGRGRLRDVVAAGGTTSCAREIATS
ncbi:MAG: PilZ domain-containing protein [Actinomycetota bacterium]|nr:PilZ domain-containing protein [Actinomycetota bacterium]